LEVIKDLLLGTAVGCIVSEVKDIDLLVLLELRKQEATVAGQGQEADEPFVPELLCTVDQPRIGRLVVPCQEQYVQVIQANLFRLFSTSFDIVDGLRDRA
jgi:hypothetical protein